MAGVAPNINIMPLKVIDNKVGYTSDVLSAIEYARQRGVQIINCSWGSPFFNQALYDVMAGNPDVLFVCAAGNVNGGQAIYPAAFGLQNILAVSSANNNGRVDGQSSYGDYVSVFAPGVDIYTSTLNDGNEFVSGTSMAAAFVTGAASIYKQYYPEATGTDIAAAIRLSLSYRGTEDPIIPPEADSSAPMLNVGAMLEILPGAELPLEERNLTFRCPMS
jgi:subtilisin family serine protease